MAGNFTRPVEDQVFGLLRKRGPLSVSQICVELILEPREVTDALEILRHERSVQLRPDSGHEVSDELLVVWGLPIGA